MLSHTRPSPRSFYPATTTTSFCLWRSRRGRRKISSCFLPFQIDSPWFFLVVSMRGCCVLYIFFFGCSLYELSVGIYSGIKERENLEMWRGIGMIDGCDLVRGSNIIVIACKYYSKKNMYCLPLLQNLTRIELAYWGRFEILFSSTKKKYSNPLVHGLLIVDGLKWWTENPNDGYRKYHFLPKKRKKKKEMTQL